MTGIASALICGFAEGPECFGLVVRLSASLVVRLSAARLSVSVRISPPAVLCIFGLVVALVGLHDPSV